MIFEFSKGSLLKLVFEQAKLSTNKPDLILFSFHFPARASIQLKTHISLFGNIDIYYHKSHRQDYNIIKSFANYSQVKFHVLQNHSKMAFLIEGNNIRCILSSNNLVSGSQYEFFLLLDGLDAKMIFDSVKDSFPLGNFF